MHDARGPGAARGLGTEKPRADREAPDAERDMGAGQLQSDTGEGTRCGPSSLGAATGRPAGSTSGLARRQPGRVAGRAKRGTALRAAEGQPQQPAESPRGTSRAPRPWSMAFLFPQPLPDPPQDPRLLQHGEFPESPHFVCVCEGHAGEGP